MASNKKDEKLKSALRDNLKKRKAQTRKLKQADEQDAGNMKVRERNLSKE